jgi:hypothetical protein
MLGVSTVLYDEELAPSFDAGGLQAYGELSGHHLLHEYLPEYITELSS